MYLPVSALYGRNPPGAFSPINGSSQIRLQDESTIRITRPRLALAAKRWQTVTRALVGYASRYRPSRLAGDSHQNVIPILPRTGQILPFRTIALNTSRFVTDNNNNATNKPLYRKLTILPLAGGRPLSEQSQNATIEETTFGHISGYAAHQRSSGPLPPASVHFDTYRSPSAPSPVFAPPGFGPQPPGDDSSLPRAHGVEQLHRLHVFPPSSHLLVDRPERLRPNFQVAHPPGRLQSEQRAESSRPNKVSWTSLYHPPAIPHLFRTLNESRNSTNDPKTTGITKNSAKRDDESMPPFPFSNCYMNNAGFMCCNRDLEQQIKISFVHVRSLRIADLPSRAARLAEMLQHDARTRFGPQFATIVAFNDFILNAPVLSDLTCKIEMEGLFITAYATAPTNIQISPITVQNASAQTVTAFTHHLRSVLTKNTTSPVHNETPKQIDAKPIQVAVADQHPPNSLLNHFETKINNGSTQHSGNLSFAERQKPDELSQSAKTTLTPNSQLDIDKLWSKSPWNNVVEKRDDDQVRNKWLLSRRSFERFRAHMAGSSKAQASPTRRQFFAPSTTTEMSTKRVLQTAPAIDDNFLFPDITSKDFLLTRPK